MLCEIEDLHYRNIYILLLNSYIMARDTQRDNFTEEYLKVLRDLPDRFAIDRYNKSCEPKVRSLFGDWLNFGKYQSEYQNFQNQAETNAKFPKSNHLESGV